MSGITTEKIALFFTEQKESETVNFMNEKANKLFCASYSRGTYGKIFLNFIKNNYPLNLNFNGGLTAIALEITDQLNKKGYDFKREGEKIIFSK